MLRDMPSLLLQAQRELVGDDRSQALPEEDRRLVEVAANRLVSVLHHGLHASRQRFCARAAPLQRAVAEVGITRRQRQLARQDAGRWEAQHLHGPVSAARTACGAMQLRALWRKAKL